MKEMIAMATTSSRAKGRRGGKKNTAPSRPAAVSGPGKLSRRTDSAAPSIEDVRGMVSETAGEEQALVDQVREGNIVSPDNQAAAQSAPQQLGGLSSGVADVFTQPTADEQMSLSTPSSMQTQDTMLEPDDVMLIRAMAEVNPTNELLGLLKFASDKMVGKSQFNI